MIDHNVVNAIKTHKERKAYFLENVEVGDKVGVGPGNREHIIIAIHGMFYWAQHSNNTPMTIYIKDMYAIK